MKPVRNFSAVDPALARAFDYASGFRDTPRPLDATQNAAALRQRFCNPLSEHGMPGDAVISDLIEAAEPGLVGNTNRNFFGWVMGGSDVTGVAADCLTSIWGQNAGIFQTSPAAAIAEEAVEAWLLDLLDLPRTSSVGLVTGATMAGFVGLAAARRDVLSRVGYDLDRDGLQAAPMIRIFICEDAHITNFAALRYLGFGEANFVKIASDTQGVMESEDIAAKLALYDGPKIIVGTAGHINSGGFDDFVELANLAKEHDAWLHVDGAFGLWARVLVEKSHLTLGLELADSWSVDGHKWLQIPYDSGFAIVKNADAHRHAMDISASYLNRNPEDGRNPTEFNPELSRRARGFAAWAVLRRLGRMGVREIVRRHCECAKLLAKRIDGVSGLEVRNGVDLNQLVFRLVNDEMTLALTERLNATGLVFVRPTVWRGQTVLRVSTISNDTNVDETERLAAQIKSIAVKVVADEKM